MNRIAEWRERRGLSQAALAARIGTTQPTVQRLETGAANLTEEWMMRIASALNVSPIDLLGIAVVAELRNEVECRAISVDTAVAAALAHKGIATYTVLASQLSHVGIKPGSTIAIDTTEAAKAALSTGDIVVVRVRHKDNGELLGTVIRQFLAPAILTTNRPGRNASFSLDDEQITVEIVGVALPQE